MKLQLAAIYMLACLLPLQAQITVPTSRQADLSDHAAWSQLFDGKTLTGWDGDPKVWSVQDGSIVGSYNTPSGTRNGGTYLVLKDLTPASFELKLEIKLEGEKPDSGIQYRSYLTPPRPDPNPPPQDPHWNMGGYQFDVHYLDSWTGQIGENGPQARGILAKRGQVVKAEAGKSPQAIGDLGSLEGLGKFYKPGEWNQVYLIVRGHEFIQIVNGHVMAILIDDDATHSRPGGLIGLQCSGPGTLKISFRNIWLKEIK